MTGHTGFKGSWLSVWLNKLGADAFGIALEPNTTPNAFEALDLKSICHHQILDIRSRENVARAVKEINPEVVFHMAAQPLVRDSYTAPIETYETNVMGTTHLLYSLSSCNSVRSIVIITTDKCYENREWSWPYRETDALGGYDPYSSSKACAEIVTASFRRSFFSNANKVGIATVRAGNVIGGGDWSRDRLIPDIVRSLQDGATLEIRNPDSIRPWQHVLAPLSGYLTLAEKLWVDPKKYSEPFNFAPTDEDCVPVRVLLDFFGSAWGTPIKCNEGISTQQRHEANLLKLDASKAKQILGWKTPWNLADALHATASWYRCYYENPANIRQLTLKQIEDFHLGTGSHGA